MRLRIALDITYEKGTVSDLTALKEEVKKKLWREIEQGLFSGGEEGNAVVAGIEVTFTTG